MKLIGFTLDQWYISHEHKCLYSLNYDMPAYIAVSIFFLYV